MCFSATASFVAGGALSAAGVMTLKQAKKKEEIPLATIPLLFGLQQATEGVVWLSFHSTLINVIATYTYSMFAQVMWPMFTPFAILAIETDPLRKKILSVCALCGVAVGICILYFLVMNPLSSHIVNCSIYYQFTRPYPYGVLALYVIATCGSCLVSSHKIINIFGVVLALSFVVAGFFYLKTFISVWCFFAAILSVIIYWYFRSNTVGTGIRDIV